jgi:hypothetical protein
MGKLRQVLGCEGIVSKRPTLWPADCWVKVKNPNAPAVKRIEEEDWNS